MELPDELKPEGMCGRLLRSLYGTQDASNIWQQDYTKLLLSGGWKPGRSNPSLFYSKATEGRGLCHGDDLMILADDDTLAEFDKLLRSRYDVKRTGALGFDPGDDHEVVMLNRVLRATTIDGEEFIEIEADSRHAELIVQKLGLTTATAAATPSVKLSDAQAVAESEEPELSAEDTTLYRSLTMRGSYLAQDRADIGDACKDLCRHMKAPNEAHLRRLKRLGRFLKGKPRVVTRYGAQEDKHLISVLVDSDHAGCVITRKSTNGDVVKYGAHTLGHGAHMQSTVSLSSGESEFYALVKGAARGLMIQAMFDDWEIAANVRIQSDSSAAIAFGPRRGLGRQRHVMTRYLWLQERVAAGHISIVKVAGEVNDSDLLTKPLSAKRTEALMNQLGQFWCDGKSMRQRDLDADT